MDGSRFATTQDERGQAHVLEGIAAAMLVLTSVIFALQVTAVTPLTASTANQHLETQAAGATAGVLATADEQGTLRETVLYWNDSGSRFHDAGPQGQYAARVPTEFGDTLEAAFRDRGMVYNVNMLYLNDAGDVREIQMLHQGDPSDHAVRVTRTVVLYDSDTLRAADENSTGVAVADSNRYFASNVEEGPVYNVIRVEVVVWRM